MTNLKVIKGPLKGKNVRLIGKYNFDTILVQDLGNGQIFTIPLAYTKEIQDKKLVSIDSKKIASVKKESSEKFIGENKQVASSEKFQDFDYPEEIEDEFIEPDLYKVGFNNLQHNLVDKNVQLPPLENKIFGFIKGFFDILYTKSMSLNDISFLAKKISKIVEKYNIPPAKYKFFISVIIYTLITKQDLHKPDTFIMKFTQDSFFDFLKNQNELKISLKDLKQFNKIILDSFYPEETKIKSKVKPKISVKELVTSVNNNNELTKKQKEILLKSIKLFPEKDFSENLNPLVKGLYLEYIGK